MKTIIGAQGEVRIVKISAMPPAAELRPITREKGGTIISHSESGHHHILTGGDVMERTANVPAGMRILYAILDAPESLVQTAPGAHGSYLLDPGIYEFRCSREFDPFANQARRVTD